MKTLLIGLRALLTALLFVTFTVSLLHAKAEYTKKEGKPCTACHVKPGSKELNDVGKCYEKKKSLQECVPPEKK